ncbi:MAG: hypothetical protein AAFO95_16395 [Cyanobacteria bacterium J06600_6]
MALFEIPEKVHKFHNQENYFHEGDELLRQQQLIFYFSESRRRSIFQIMPLIVTKYFE